MKYIFYLFVILVLVYLYILYMQHKDSLFKTKESFISKLKPEPLKPSQLSTTHKSQYTRYMTQHVTTTNMFHKV